MFCAVIIFALALVILVQNRAVLFGDLQKLKQAWGIGSPPTAPPPTPPAA